MKLLCPSCGAAIRADDMNLDRLVAKCRECDSVFAFAPDGALRGGRRRPHVDLPARIRIENHGSGVVLTRRWLSAKYYLLLVFSIVWNTFLVGWYAAVTAADAPLLFKLFPILHVAVGVGLTYSVVCGFVNRTRIAADGETLTVRHGPLPWPGAREIPARELAQLYTIEKVSQSRNGESRDYRVQARLRSGADVKLVSGLAGVEQALFIEQELEAFLGITDEVVPGEYPRTG